MATQITSPANGKPILTSELDEIYATTDKTKVAVTLSYAGQIIFSTVLYPINHKVTLTQPGRLIEEYFRKHGITDGNVSVTMDDAGISIRCIYCEYRMPRTFSIDGCFLSTLDTQCTHAGSWISCSAIGLGSPTPLQIQAIARDTETTLHLAGPITLASHSESFCSYLSVDNIINHAAEYLAEHGVTLEALLHFTVNYGIASKAFYILDDPEFFTLCFRNIFNALETIDIVGTVTTKTEISNDTAQCTGITTQYNHKALRTYEIQTAAIPIAQARAIDQLFNSREIYLIPKNRDDADEKIIITDHTCEISNDDSTLASVKFTWRFPADRIYLLDDELSAFRHSGSVFSEQYTQQFT